MPDEPLVVDAAVQEDKIVYFKVHHGAWEQPESLRDPLGIEPGTPITSMQPCFA